MSCIKTSRNLYVIASLDNPTMYVRYINGSYILVDKIYRATKTTDKNVANEIIYRYRYTTGDTNTELVAIPLKITYELIDERE